MVKILPREINGLFLRIKERFLLFQKRRNKNIVISKNVGLYVQKLLSNNFPDSLVAEYEKILTEEDSSYQTPMSEISFLTFLIKASKSEKILEAGTFRGFTSLCFSFAISDCGSVFSCEKNDKYKKIAREMWSRFGKEKQIRLLEGDALNSMSDLIKKGEVFDFIYIDADKSLYTEYYEASLKLARNGTIVAIDNSLWAGLVAEPKTNYSHARIINQLNELIFSNPTYLGTLIPAWDGLIVVQINKR